MSNDRGLASGIGRTGRDRSWSRRVRRVSSRWLFVTHACQAWQIPRYVLNLRSRSRCFLVVSSSAAGRCRPQRGQHEIGHVRKTLGTRGWGEQIASKSDAQRSAVGLIEMGETCNRNVELYAIDIVTHFHRLRRPDAPHRQSMTRTVNADALPCWIA